MIGLSSTHDPGRRRRFGVLEAETLWRYWRDVSGSLDDRGLELIRRVTGDAEYVVEFVGTHTERQWLTCVDGGVFKRGEGT